LTDNHRARSLASVSSSLLGFTGSDDRRSALVDAVEFAKG
jgi:hypothetical protein